MDKNTIGNDPTDTNAIDNTGKGENMVSPLQKIIQWFKTMTTNAYIHGVKDNG